MEMDRLMDDLGERVGEEAGMDVDSRKVVRGRIGLVRCVSGRMLGYQIGRAHV